MNKKGFAGIIVLILIVIIGSIVFFVYKNSISDIYISPSPTPAVVNSPKIVLPESGKPVIYLYPTELTNVTVHLDYNGTITDTYPSINKNNLWKVTAFPDGKLISHEDGNEYSYIFWEGKLAPNQLIDTRSGFVVSGEDTKDFLQNKLKYLGLTSNEYNEFIVYWMPKMQHNKYNYIKFLGDEYTKNAKLTISPEPDSILRVFMIYKALNEKINIEPQILTTFNRTGFSVIEWGGSEI